MMYSVFLNEIDFISIVANRYDYLHSDLDYAHIYIRFFQNENLVCMMNQTLIKRIEEA